MARTYAKRFRKAEWDQHREFVRQRYLIDHMTLEEVHRALATQRQFSVSLNQLEYRCKKIWDFSKYLDGKVWQEIGALRASDGGEERHFFSKGRRLSQRKVNKGIKRRGLHQQGSSSQALAQIAVASYHPMMGVKGMSTGLASCPGTFDTSNSLKILPGAEEKSCLAAVSSLGPSERADLLSKIINQVVDSLENDLQWFDPESRTAGFRVDAIIDAVRFSEVASFGLNSIDIKTEAFQATLLRLWNSLFDLEDFPVEGELQCDSYTEDQLHRVVEWLLPAVTDNSLLAPSISERFFDLLFVGATKVALLLWPLMKIDQSSYLVIKPLVDVFAFRSLVSVRTEASATLVREILHTGHVELMQLIVRSSAQHSRTDDFKEIFASVAASFTRRGYKCRSNLWSPSFIRQVFGECVDMEPEESPIEKVAFVVKEFKKLGLQLMPSHIDIDTFKRAATGGSLRLLEYLHGISPNLALKDRHGFSALHTAADYDRLELCKWIFQHTPESQHDADSILLALSVALAKGHLEVCHFFEERLVALYQRQISAAEWRALLCHCNHPTTLGGKRPPFEVAGFGLNTEKSQGCVLCTGALVAARMGRESLLRFHLDHGARGSLDSTLDNRSLYTSDRLDGFRSITLETSLGHMWSFSRYPGSLPARMRCAELLISRGIQPTRDNLITSLAAGEWPMAQLLMVHFDALPEMPGTLLEAAICGQDEQCIIRTRQMTDGTYDPAALCTAVAFSSNSILVRDITFELASRRVASDLGSQLESTAIALAAIQGDIELFTRLLDAIPSHHPYAHCPDDAASVLTGSGPAIWQFQKDIRESFFAERGDSWSQRCGKCSLLGLTAICNRPAITRTLMGLGHQPDLRACSMAVAASALAPLEMFIQGQPALREWTQPEDDSHDPLHAAIIDADDSTSDFYLISLLLSAGANINFGRSLTLLSEAVKLDNLQLVKFLLDQGADINRRCDSEAFPTALHHAITTSAEMVELLIARGADVNAPPSRSGPTCLQLAARRFDMLEMLISEEVRVDGHYRLDYIIAVSEAQGQGSTLISQRLQQYGGWHREDQEILSIVRARKDRKWDAIRDGVAFELARRAGEVIEADSLGTPIDTVIPEIPENSGSSPTNHLTPMSPWQHFQSSFGSMGFLHPFSDASFGYVDIPSSQCCPNDFDGWLGVSGPRFLREEAEDIEMERNEEMPDFAW